MMNPEEWPDPIQRFLSHMNEEIYVTMQGPSEFEIGGKLAHWNRRNELKKIKVPTLIIGAKYDTMDSEHLKWISTQVQNGNYLYCPNGSHW